MKHCFVRVTSPHKGKVAEEFAILIKSLWTGQYRCVVPRDFKVSLISDLDIKGDIGIARLISCIVNIYYQFECMYYKVK